MSRKKSNIVLNGEFALAVGLFSDTRNFATPTMGQRKGGVCDERCLDGSGNDSRNAKRANLSVSPPCLNQWPEAAI